MQDAIAIMHKLQTGIDVNVHFTGIDIQNIFKVSTETKTWCYFFAKATVMLDGHSLYTLPCYQHS